MKQLFSAIRPAVATDAVAIGQLAQEFAEYLRGLGDRTDFKLTAETVLRDGFGVNPAFAGLVAEDSDVVVGYLLYHFGYDSDRAARILYIADLFVTHAARRGGVGTALLVEVARIARAAGAESLIWSVYQHNAEATRFYQACGATRLSDVFFMSLEAGRI